MAKRKIEKNYRDLAKSRGFKWVGKNLPKNIDTPTKWVCNNIHKWSASYHNIYKGSGCPYCYGNAKKVEKDYHNLAKSREFKWVDKKLPPNVLTKTLWQCKRGHRWKSKYADIYSGRGCPYCYGHVKKNVDDYNSLATEVGFKWVGKVLPDNVMTKTWWECEKGHKWRSRYNDIYNGNRCPYCSNCINKTKKDYNKLAEKFGFVWVGSVLPKTTHYKTWWKCEKRHLWETTYHSIQQGSGCPICKDLINGVPVSKPQRKLNNLLCGILNYPESRYRIDVAIMRKSQKIAVEYDAQYWHKGREEHDTKRDDYLVSKGWKVLHIKSGEMLPTKKQTKQAINQLLKDRDIVNLYLEDWV